jgi:cytochrome b561
MEPSMLKNSNLNRRRGDYVPDERYDPTTIWLHWAMVVLIVILWVIGMTADWLPRGTLRTGAWSVHVVLGFATGFVLLTRIAWRAQFGRVLPPADTGILHAIAVALRAVRAPGSGRLDRY